MTNVITCEYWPSFISFCLLRNHFGILNFIGFCIICVSCSRSSSLSSPARRLTSIPALRHTTNANRLPTPFNKSYRLTDIAEVSQSFITNGDCKRYSNCVQCCDERMTDGKWWSTKTYRYDSRRPQYESSKGGTFMVLYTLYSKTIPSALCHCIHASLTLIAVSANGTFLFPSIFVFITRCMCWNFSGMISDIFACGGSCKLVKIT